MVYGMANFKIKLRMQGIVISVISDSFFTWIKTSLLVPSNAQYVSRGFALIIHLSIQLLANTILTMTVVTSDSTSLALNNSGVFLNRDICRHVYVQ